MGGNICYAIITGQKLQPSAASAAKIEKVESEVALLRDIGVLGTNLTFV